MKRSIRCTAASLTLAALLVIVPPRPASAGPLIDLGTLGGSMSFGSKINNRGDIIGSSTTAGDSATLAFIRDASGMRALTLGGTFSQANDINNAGVVVGGSFTEGDAGFQAFVHVNGETRMLSLGGSSGTALDVNDAGQVVGYSNLLGDQESRAFVYDVQTDVMTDLGTFGGTQSVATAINEAGQVIGYSYLEGDASTHAFRYSNGQMIALHLGGTGSFANAINAHGQVVGTSLLAGDTEFRAFAFDGVQMIDLGGLGGTYSEATGINDQGIVIGNGNLPGDRISRGFRFDGMNLTQLTLGGGASFATAINSQGQIAGESFTANGGYQAFRYDSGAYTPISLGGQLTYALDINERGEVVGIGQIPGSEDLVAYRLSRRGIDQLSLGGPESTAWDINDEGEVAGEAELPNGEVRAFYAAAVPLDSIAPTTTFSVSSEPNSAGWYSSTVTVTLHAEDDPGGTGVKEVAYSVNGGQSFTTVSGADASFQVSADGVHQIGFFAEDNIGNREETQWRTIRLDRTAPTVTVCVDPNSLNPPNGKLIPVRVTGTIADALAGFKEASFWVEDEYCALQPTGSVNVGPDGAFAFTIMLEARRDGGDPDGRKYTVNVKAWDKAGNRGSTFAVVMVPH